MKKLHFTQKLHISKLKGHPKKNTIEQTFEEGKTDPTSHHKDNN